MGKLDWYWHRLRAMERGEVAAHVRKKLYQFQDARQLPDWSDFSLEPAGAFPKLPSPDTAPVVLREALTRDAADILAGRWRAFGHLKIQVDDPPRWHKDYLAGKDLETSESAFRLNHRELPGGADIKLIWELSRWYQIVRLAMAAYVLGDERAAGKCVEWLEDWLEHNSPYRGWNWTSALESGMRLVQFTWIDALLSTRSGGEKSAADKNSAALSRDAATLERLRREILPAHVWYAWRYRSFGSSANNHLIGELTGLILAVSRWPELAKCSAPLDTLQTLWEREVLAQFAEDGGNKEQALNYHLFAWEFCWQARKALVAAGRRLSITVEDRLKWAAAFYWEVQVRREPWDYGDSDSAFVTPFFSTPSRLLTEWRDWIGYAPGKTPFEYWLGSAPQFQTPLGSEAPLLTSEAEEWWVYSTTGVGIYESSFWWLRWDLSPLGYLRTAAHGHLDALHLSIWFNGVAIVIDPGTGAYYADPDLRAWLASGNAHNAPSPAGLECPRRLGPFLWARGYGRPTWSAADKDGVMGQSALSACSLFRTVRHLSNGSVWEVTDRCEPLRDAPDRFTVRWQFAPGARLEQSGDRGFRLKRNGVVIDVEVSDDWAEIYPVIERNSGAFTSAATTELEAQFAGTVSPAFRKIEWAPFLKLVARPKPGKPCVFRTTFLASPSS